MFGSPPGTSGFGAPVSVLTREGVVEFEVDGSESEPKAAYQPPILVDYGLLAKEAAEGGAGSGTFDGISYS